MGLRGQPRRSTTYHCVAGWWHGVATLPPTRVSLSVRRTRMVNSISRSTLVVAAALVSSMSVFAAAPVGDALQRPALSVSQPQRAVLLAAAPAGARVVAVGERGVIALSDDGGATWRQAACSVTVTLTMVRFADDRHGVVVGHGGTVLTTS